MPTWHDLLIGILIGVLGNSVYSFLGLIGKRQLAFYIRLISTRLSPNKPYFSAKPHYSKDFSKTALPPFLVFKKNFCYSIPE
jgi:hypothetical protein